MQVRLLLTASVQLSGWFNRPFPSSGPGRAPNKARVEPWLMPAPAAQALLHPGTQAAARTRRASSAVRAWARIHPGCAGFRLALRHVTVPGVVWHSHVQGQRARGTAPGWLRVSWQSPACAGCGPALLSRGGEALTLTERVQATSLPWGTRSKVSTTSRPCWRRRSDLGGFLEMPLLCLELLALPVQIH